MFCRTEIRMKDAAMGRTPVSVHTFATDRFLCLTASVGIYIRYTVPLPVQRVDDVCRYVR
jgi:hypothetical protein